jgi:hypothetical protein
VAESSWPTIAAGRAVTDDQYELMAAGYATDGVIGQWTDPTPVYADSSGRQVKIRANFTALVGGHGYSSGTSDTIKSIAANSSGSTRIDLIVLRLTRSTMAVTSEVKAGTPGAGVPPALTRDARGSGTGVWEIPIGQVTVANGAATLAAGTVTNIAWYSRMGTVATLSTSTLQPEVSIYPWRQFTDTGVRYESISGAWRAHPWQTAWGIIGGRRYQSNTTVAGPIGLTEAVGNIQSGTINLVADRRYRIHVHCRVAGDSTGISFTARARETNISGTTVGLWQQTMVDFGWSGDYHFVNEFISPGTTTRTYILTLKTEGGLVNSNSGTANTPSGIWVEDVGPATPNVVTVTA